MIRYIVKDIMAQRPPEPRRNLWLICWNMDTAGNLNPTAWLPSWPFVKGHMFRRVTIQDSVGRNAVPLLVGRRIDGSAQPVCNQKVLCGWDTAKWIYTAGVSWFFVNEQISKLICFSVQAHDTVRFNYITRHAALESTLQWIDYLMN